jgi:hypothetical protein
MYFSVSFFLLVFYLTLPLSPSPSLPHSFSPSVTLFSPCSIFEKFIFKLHFLYFQELLLLEKETSQVLKPIDPENRYRIMTDEDK